MTETDIGQYLVLEVTNPAALRLGSTPRCNFGRAGGTIGSAGATWLLSDSHGGIEPLHCEVAWRDNAFCLLDHSGHTRINGSIDPLGRGVRVRLSDGDTLQIGPYGVAVHMGSGALLVETGRSMASVGQLLNERVAMFDDERDDDGRTVQFPVDGQASTESAVPPTWTAQDELDPLKALDAGAANERARAAGHPLDMRHYGLAVPHTQTDLAATRFEAISGSPMTVPGDQRMSPSDDHSMHGFTAPQLASGDPNSVVAPLVQGLGAPVGALDAESGYRFLQEAGQALGALIRGMAGIYGSQAGAQHRAALLGRSLQPIEDNPLRLGLDYPETVRALFSSDRSVVHLAPQAAVEESLNELRRHHTAVIRAIEVGLDELLRAFSPELLLERFRRYRTGPAQWSQGDDWAWQMYTHYYHELISARQQGFEKLFWEVFEQAYDQAMRAESR